VSDGPIVSLMRDALETRDALLDLAVQLELGPDECKELTNTVLALTDDMKAATEWATSLRRHAEAGGVPVDWRLWFDQQVAQRKREAQP
jgi:hypothetical protein